MIEPERKLRRASIAEPFDAGFFRTDFWFIWGATFASQPWHSASAGTIMVSRRDYVLVTLGSMTQAPSLGSMDTAPARGTRRDGGAWTLWEAIAASRPECRHPAVFADHINHSQWVSFTTTRRDPTLLRLVRALHDIAA